MMTRSLFWLLIPALFSAGPVASSRSPAGQVTALSLSSNGGSARFAVSIEGGATVRDFQLHSPERLVLEVSPATTGDLARYDGLRRGIVSEVRVNQFDSTTVRIVVEFDRMPTFSIDKSTAGLVTVAYDDQPFQSWQSGLGGEKLASRAANTTPREPVRRRRSAGSRPTFPPGSNSSRVACSTSRSTRRRSAMCSTSLPRRPASRSCPARASRVMSR